MFFPNLFKWLKGHGKLLAAILTIAITVFGGIQSCRANRWEAEAQRLDGKLAEQQADQDLLYAEAAKERETRNIAETKEKEKRKELEASIQKYKNESEFAKQALVAEKEKTATMPPTELVEAINQRIGDESSLTGAGLFLFTRLGTNRTLDRFKDGEFYLSEYNKFQGVLSDHEAEVDSFNESIAACEEVVIDNLMGWEDCRETLATAVAGRAADKKTAKGNTWRGRKQGAFWTLVIAGGLKLFGVW